MTKLGKIFGISVKTIVYTFLLLLALVFLSLSVASVNWFVEYSSLPIGLTKAFVGIIVLGFIDDIVFNKVDTLLEIRNKNTAYAIIYLGNAIIVATCLSIA